jgi:hypothetical protein
MMVVHGACRLCGFISGRILVDFDSTGACRDQEACKKRQGHGKA